MIENPPTTAVYLSPDDSAKFLLFMEHYDVIHTLLDMNVFAVKNASVTINFDWSGKPTSIETRTLHRLKI